MKEDYLDKIEKLEEALLNYMGENDLKILKTGFPYRWKLITKKLRYPYEYFSSVEDYQKPVDNLKKEDFFSNLKNDYPDDREIERKKQIIKLFNSKNGQELTQPYLKSDVLLLTCAFEKFIKVSFNEIGINPLYCVSLPGYTWQCGLKNTGINLQTRQEKNLFLTSENNVPGGISSVMGDRFMKSDENKKILYIDATTLYGHSMIQPLPYDEIEMWHGHPDLYMNKLDEILTTPDDSDFGYFLENGLKYSATCKEKTKSFPFCPENKVISKDINNDCMRKLKPKKYTRVKKLICDWTDKKKYLVQYRMFKFYVRHGMIVEKIHEFMNFI